MAMCSVHQGSSLYAQGYTTSFYPSTYTKNKSYTYTRKGGLITGSSLNSLLDSVLHLSMTVTELGLLDTNLGISLYYLGFTNFSSPVSDGSSATPTPTPTPTPDTDDGEIDSGETEDDGTEDDATEDENTITLPSGNTVTTNQTEEKTTITAATETGETIAKITLPAEPDKGKEFNDVKDGDWYKKAVDNATGYGLFSGVTDTTFEPETGMNRAMLAQVLYNLSGKLSYGTDSTKFNDANGWYKNAVNWAATVGVVSGTGNGKFEPEEKITREQLVVMLYNFAKAIGVDNDKSVELSSFADSSKVSSWASNAMKWAVANGLMGGSQSANGMKLNPKDTATRAEVATVLVKFVEYLKQ